ncbi:hypothetical protein [Vibrio coralliilyticus]|uniref:hypothetical protein n=1 Tax=Vibrio coralliilyticus TaxID=190893 RepID=UPI001E315644|nr:hypothetical protein [Vibrio coralliilyticus]MCC2524318.1 hypothetical protein [Vibrio coralliilyticus]
MKLEQSMEDFLNPKLLRERLVSVSLYVLIFETLKDSLVDKLRFYYCLGEKETEQYRHRVKSRNRSVVYASLDWYKESGALTDDDISLFDRIRSCRNLLSHELHTVIGSKGLPENFHENFACLLDLAHKVDHWWIMNVEVPTDPKFMGKPVNPKDVTPGSTLLNQMIIQIALGEDEEANQYLKFYEEYKASKALKTEP